MSSHDELLTRLRGKLPAEEPGARGLEHLARNPGCQRLHALVMTGLSPATAMRDVYGDDPREGQSPFAIATGHTFERHLFDDQAQRLLTLYRDAGRLTESEARIAVVPDLVAGRGPDAMRRRQELTRLLLRKKLRRDESAPHLIVKPRLSIRLLGVEHGIEPDALIASEQDPFYRVIEIKSYPDRGGKTDAADVRSACRQAADDMVLKRRPPPHTITLPSAAHNRDRRT